MKFFQQTKNKKGITLVETMVAMLIFSLMVVSMTSIFTTLIQRRYEVKKMQQQTEEFSLASSYMAKKIRMSNTADCSASQCVLSGGAGNVTFAFGGGNLTENGNGIVTGISGAFIKSAGAIPLITFSLMAIGKPETSVQTSVSLRNY